MEPHNSAALHRAPLISAGILIGAGMGGFVDGILLHQLLQWHNMLSGKMPPNNLIDAKVNMYWDGVFHAAVWAMTALGLRLLWSVGRRQDVPWSGRSFSGALVLGWGLFNVIEGILDHHVLGLHHVYEYTDNHLPADLGFLAFGAMQLALGWALIRAGRADTRTAAAR